MRVANMVTCEQYDIPENESLDVGYSVGVGRRTMLTSRAHPLKSDNQAVFNSTLVNSTRDVGFVHAVTHPINHTIDWWIEWSSLEENA